MTSKIARRLGELRRKTGLSQDAFSDLIGCAQSTYANWESGRNPPPGDWVVILSRHHGVTADFLLCMTDHEGPLPPDAWVVDDDFVDAVRAGTWSRKKHGDTGTFPIPRRARIVSSVEHKKLDRELGKLIRAIEERGE